VSWTLTLLHVSDLHERGSREKDASRRRRVLGEAWLKQLDELAKEGPPIDLVCVTGDVADRGQAEVSCHPAFWVAEPFPAPDLEIGRAGECALRRCA
jgi:3',5'-cyclic AMP phosphodiesterase CpdA